MLDALSSEHFDTLYRAIAPAAIYQGDLPLTLNRTTAAYFQYAQANCFRLIETDGCWPPFAAELGAARAICRMLFFSQNFAQVVLFSKVQVGGRFILSKTTA